MLVVSLHYIITSLIYIQLALYNLGVNSGDSIGPILGGFLTEKKGFEYTCFAISLLNILVFALFILGNLKTIDAQLEYKIKSNLEGISSNALSLDHSMNNKSDSALVKFDNSDNDNKNIQDKFKVSDNQYYISYSKENQSKSLRPKMSFLENMNQ